MDQDKPVVQLGYIMMRIHRRIRKNAEDALRDSNSSLRFEHMIILRLIRVNEGELAQSVVVDYLPMFDKHRVSRLCAEIEELGYIHRLPNPSNRRENVLSITDEGTSTILEFMDLATQANTHVFSGMTEKDIDQLFSMLGRVLNNLETEESQSSL